jgi:hypothetical protein
VKPPRPREPTNQHLCVSGGVDQDRRRRARDRYRLDGDIRVTDDLVDHRGHEPLPCLLDLRKDPDEVEAGRWPRLGHRRRRLPRVYGDDLGRTQPSLFERPAQRVLRCLRAVDANDDLRHPGFLPCTTR